MSDLKELKLDLEYLLGIPDGVFGDREVIYGDLAESALVAIATLEAKLAVAREAALVEAADKIEALLPMPGNGRQMHGTYAQGVFDALQIVRAALTKEPDQ